MARRAQRRKMTSHARGPNKRLNSIVSFGSNPSAATSLIITSSRRRGRANLTPVFDRTQIIDRQFAFAVNGELPGPVE